MYEGIELARDVTLEFYCKQCDERHDAPGCIRDGMADLLNEDDCLCPDCGKEMTQ